MIHSWVPLALPVAHEFLNTDHRLLTTDDTPSSQREASMAMDIKPVTEEQQREFAAMLGIGCDSETAGKFLGIALDQVHTTREVDPAFDSRLLRAEATAEFNHMRNLHEAAKDPKNWRVSVWWLERHAPERFAQRAPGTLTTRQIHRLIDKLSQTIAEEVTHFQDQQRLLTRFAEIIDGIGGEGVAEVSAQLSAAEDAADSHEPGEPR